MVLAIGDIWMLHCDFNAFVEVRFIRAGETREFKTYEQLWLAFVMKEQYGKVWTGSAWMKPFRDLSTANDLVDGLSDGPEEW